MILNYKQSKDQLDRSNIEKEMEVNRGKWDQVIVDLQDIKKLYSKLEKENVGELEM